MICANLYYHNQVLWGFKIEGHSGYAEHGTDIICAAISVLVFNTVNSINEFTDEEVHIHKMDPEKGLFDCEFPKRKLQNSSEKAELLLNAMVLGLNTIEQTYGENYIKVKTNRR
ncbi:ribosomal-processing cysteine protease Prp [Cellulosilyticum sp. I15G10I2]|uniref:ribosomal-processing cysteine protease Prp n=1 Tax=Cellulosilyticum sp. I15G10I2 TaxID=1892843 RepID=UPI00085CD403|nr:ribosomal-processing cysteine protease Prp [Cellulosilyticum sp. I15G10I2]